MYLSSGAIAGVLVWLLTGGGVGLFARKVDMKTFMPDATGLLCRGRPRAAQWNSGGRGEKYRDFTATWTGSARCV